MVQDTDAAVIILKQPHNEENDPNQKSCPSNGNARSTENRPPQPTHSFAHGDPANPVTKEPPITYWLRDREQRKSPQLQILDERNILNDLKNSPKRPQFVHKYFNTKANDT